MPTIIGPVSPAPGSSCVSSTPDSDRLDGRSGCAGCADITHGTLPVGLGFDILSLMAPLKIAVATRCLNLPLKESLRAAARFGAAGVQFDAREELRPG